jgi:hypothetical protein
MISRYISTFLAILACVLVAAALIGWLATNANTPNVPSPKLTAYIALSAEKISE